jgi:hypothetical protein
MTDSILDANQPATGQIRPLIRLNCSANNGHFPRSARGHMLDGNRSHFPVENIFSLFNAEAEDGRDRTPLISGLGVRFALDCVTVGIYYGVWISVDSGSLVN